MYDYGEYVSPHTLTHSLLPGAAAHNLYPLQYQQAAFEFFMVGREGGSERGREGGRVLSAASFPVPFLINT
jgi:hypothetical protein